MNNQREWPNVFDWFLSVPLYREIEFISEEVWNIYEIMYFKRTLDSYCIECQKESTFQGVTPERPAYLIRDKALAFRRKAVGASLAPPNIDGGTFKVILKCTRNTIHQHYHFFLVRHGFKKVKNGFIDAGFFQKVGQYPSYGDLHIPKLKKYSKVLSQKDLGELTRAVGLASHDVGVGSYVYLRRVFESLIEEAHDIAKSDKNWDDDKYKTSRMADKIKMLEKHLPEFLVQNPQMYSLLSKGVHEMTEDECLKYFNTLKIGIELILDEKIEYKEKQLKIKEAEKDLQKAFKKTKENA
jgi:hypothetical protein